jgi:hypothetical protein
MIKSISGWAIGCIVLVTVLGTDLYGEIHSKGSEVQALRIKNNSIAVDGQLTESGWATVKQSFLLFSTTGEKPSVQTEFKILYDDEALYVGVRCEGPGKPFAQKKKCDEAVWEDDCIELFLDPTGKGEECFHFIVNSVGAIYDEYCADMYQRNSNWNTPDIAAVGFVGEGFWNVEIRIPFYAIAVSPRGTNINPKELGFNVVREYKGGIPNLLIFTPVGNLFNFKAFAHLAPIEADFDPYRWNIGSVKLLNLIPKNNQYEVKVVVPVENISWRFQAFGLSAEICASDKPVQTINVAKTFAADAGQTQMMPFTFTLPKSENITMRFQLVNRETGNLVASKRENLFIDVSPLSVEVIHPFYRSAIYATMVVDKIKLEVSSRWTIPMQGNEKAVIMLKDKAGKKVVETSRAQTKSLLGIYELRIPKLAPGEYHCIVEIRRNANMLYSAQTTLYVYGPSKSEVRINEYLNYVINGKEFFPVGFYNCGWGMSEGKDTNIGIGYCTYEHLPSPEKGPLTPAGKYIMMYPHPRALWSHWGAGAEGHPELAGKPLPEPHAKMIRQGVSSYQNCLGLGGWFLSDEPQPDRELPLYLEQLYQMVQSGDPYHPCYLSHNFGFKAQLYDKAADVHGIHWYPGFSKRGLGYPLVTVAEHVEAARKVTQGRKLIIVEPLMFMFTPDNDPDVRPVKHNESRCMAYLGLVHGAKGVIWFSTEGLTQSLETRLGMPVLIKELLALQNVFLAHEEVKIPIVDGKEKAIHVLGKVVNGSLYIVLVNSEPQQEKTVLKLPDRWTDLKALTPVASESSSIEVKDGKINLTFEPYDVWILTNDPAAPKLETKEELYRQFERQHRAFLAERNFCYDGQGTDVETSNDFGQRGFARLTINGYRDYSGQTITTAAQNSWMEVRFPKAQSVGRIEVSSNHVKDKGGLKDYRLELQVNGRLIPIQDTQTSKVEMDGKVFTQIHTFSPVEVQGIRLTMLRPMQEAGVLNEIQTFSK